MFEGMRVLINPLTRSDNKIRENMMFKLVYETFLSIIMS